MTATVNPSKPEFGCKHNAMPNSLTCSFQEGQIEEIIRYICALRNSNGGTLIVSFRECPSISEDEIIHQAEIINHRVDDSLSNTTRTDLLYEICPTKIIYLVQGSKNVVTMDFNMYILENGEVELISPNKYTATDIQYLILSSPKGTVTKMEKCHSNIDSVKPKDRYDDITVFDGDQQLFDWTKTEINNDAIEYSGMKGQPISKFIKDEIVEIDNTDLELCRFEKLEVRLTEDTIVNRIFRPEYNLHKHVNSLSEHLGGHVYYGISKDGTVMGVKIRKAEQKEVCNIEEVISHVIKEKKRHSSRANVNLRRVSNKKGKKISNLFVIDIYVPPLEKTSNFLPGSSRSYTRKPGSSSENNSLIIGREMEVKRTATVKFRILKGVNDNVDCSNPTRDVARCILLPENKLFSHISAFANGKGGELYYGILKDGIIRGEAIKCKETKVILKKIEKELNSAMVLPEQINITRFIEITFIPVIYVNKGRHVIRIAVNPCEGGVFVKLPESYYIWNNRVAQLPFSTWLGCIRESTTPNFCEEKFVKFKENETAFERFFLPSNYDTVLKSLDWVESFRIVDKNDECDTRHLEIVYKYDAVPRNSEIVKGLGENILPLITYQKGSKRVWFETNVFDENWDMNENYGRELASLPWVEEFYIGRAIRPEKSWQIYITCKKNELPSMADLKTIFGVDISTFVDFIQDNTDEEAEHEPPSTSFLRRPISGDDIHGTDGSAGAIGILTGYNQKHYATTCYHVCFEGPLPEDIEQAHKLLLDDCTKNSSKGCGANYLYTIRREGKQRSLGKFCCGLYDNNHDIALVELDANLDCSDTVQHLAKESIEPDLASKEEVKNMFFERTSDSKMPVSIIRPGGVTGKLVAISGTLNSQLYQKCYWVQESSKNPFAIEGDSGSLVYLIHEDKKVPFAYLCRGPAKTKSGKSIYFCRNLAHSIEELGKKHHPLPRGIKPCLGECGTTTDDREHGKAP